MATPAAWNRQEDKAPLGGPSETLGGGTPPDNFVVLHHVPLGTETGLDPPDVAPNPSDPGQPGAAPASAPAAGDTPGGQAGAETGGGAGTPADAGNPGGQTGETGGQAGVPGGGQGGNTANADSVSTGDIGEFSKGGLVTQATAQAERGEFVVNAAAVKKYGVAFLASLNRGRLRAHDHTAYVQHHIAKSYGGASEPVPMPRRRNHTMLRGA